MPIIDGFRAELEHESALTRTMLERLPENALDWAPHPRSFPMRRLASHLAEMYAWVDDILKKTELVFKPGEYKPWLCTGRADLLATFEEGLKKAFAAMAGIDDAALMVPWSLKMGDQVLFTMPRVQVLRAMVMNHVIHHRAQLGVYYRICGVPVPAIYGPSADEGKM